MSALLNAAVPVVSGLLAVDPEKVKPGWLGLIVVLILCAATYLLWRSMNRQLNKVNFDDGRGDDGSVIENDDDAAASSDNGNPRL